ncbi:hypothetical protein F0562_001298 [Nyssa sinensis]|uniref:Bet v I/Major latex protein domain-containing protein n=1 Tax=Nyssa sinensis TaxID=561372 RepID=A0A5J5C4D1_9ASTE|nr:hypothetical protein F0562_001298 [Nyssa sinensis]
MKVGVCSDLAFSKVDLLNASRPSISLDDFDALNSLWHEFGNQVVRVKDCGLEYPCRKDWGCAIVGGNFNYMKHRIDELNEKTYTYTYTLIEGDALMDKLEKICFEVKLEGSPNGGTISKMTSKYYTKDDFVLTEEEIKAGKDKVFGMYKVVEAYLLQNPDAYV